jgi:hypothetical protein
VDIADSARKTVPRPDSAARAASIIVQWHPFSDSQDEVMFTAGIDALLTF